MALAIFARLICVVAFISFIHVVASENRPFARENQFPYQASLLFVNGNKQSFCGGALIAYEWVLTSAQCIVGINAQSAKVYFGTTKRLFTVIDIEVSKDKFHWHSKFNATTGLNNIALIKIPSMRNKPNTQPIALPKIGSTIYVDSNVIATGWGKPGYDTTFLRYVDYKIISNKKCSNSFAPGVVYDGLICTDKGYSFCFSEPGSPLVLKSPRVLVGILSFTPLGCKPSVPLGFTRITYFHEWIQSTMFFFGKP